MSLSRRPLNAQSPVESQVKQAFLQCISVRPVSIIPRTPYTHSFTYHRRYTVLATDRLFCCKLCSNSFTQKPLKKHFTTEIADIINSRQTISALFLFFLKDTQTYACRNTNCCHLANTKCIPHIFFGYDDRVNCIHDPKHKAEG